MRNFKSIKNAYKKTIEIESNIMYVLNEIQTVKQ